MERLLQQFLHSPAHRGFQFAIGAKALKDSLKGYEKTPKYQRLLIDFEKGEDPDDAYSSIPYEKGANLILHLGTHPSSLERVALLTLFVLWQSEPWEVSTFSCLTFATTSRHSAERASLLGSGKTIFINTSRSTAAPKRSNLSTASTGT
jgi:hypothetical protein